MAVHSCGDTLILRIGVRRDVLAAAAREQSVVEDGAPVLAAGRIGATAARVEFERHARIVGYLQMNILRVGIVAVGDTRKLFQAHSAARMHRRIGDLEAELLQIISPDGHASIGKAVEGSELLRVVIVKKDREKQVFFRRDEGREIGTGIVAGSGHIRKRKRCISDAPHNAGENERGLARGASRSCLELRTH